NFQNKAFLQFFLKMLKNTHNSIYNVVILMWGKELSNCLEKQVMKSDFPLVLEILFKAFIKVYVFVQKLIYASK
ncbi:hypothetical protein ACMBCN_00560, partial [Candidatus Liberibacter asiaticus]|nr:hypothetical protein [Candidatus Liberibacter asiaticus]